MRELILVGFCSLIVLFAVKCQREVIGIPASDIDIKLEAGNFSVKNGDVVDFYLSVTNIGPDDVSGLQIRFKQASNNLKFIEDNKDSYDGGIWEIDNLEAAMADTLIVTAQGQLPDLLPAVSVQQSAYVFHNQNFDPNLRNNYRAVTVAVIP